jgi:hypothetical protein
MWTWNATLGVWSAESGVKGEYLSKTDDDTAQGEITFQQGIEIEPYPINVNNGNLQVSTNGNPLVTVKPNGFVGVGSTDPSQQLEVSGNVNVIGSGNLLMQNTNRVQWGSSDTAFISGQDGGSGYLSLGAGGDRVRIQNNGNVGINTINPAGVLNVQTNVGTGPSLTYDSGNILNLDYGAVQLAVGIDPVSPFSSYLQARDNGNGSRPLTLNPVDGNVGVNTFDARVTFEVKKGSNATEYYPAQYTNSFAASILNCQDGSDQHGLFVANRWAGFASQVLEVGSLYTSEGTYNSYLRVRGDGFVGVGRTAPKERLDVNGNLQIGQDTGYGFVQLGNNGSWLNNWHVGSNGVGGFEIYNGNLGSTSSKKLEIGANDTKLISNLKVAPPTTNGEGGDIVLTRPNQNDPGLTLDVLNDVTYRLFTTVGNSTLQIGNLASGAHSVVFYCGDAVSPMNMTQGYTYFNKDVRYGYANTQVFPGIGNLDVGGITSISPTNGTILALSRLDGEPLALNRTGTNGDLISMRKNGQIKGSLEVNDANIRITGLAGGPLFRAGYNIDSSDGLIEAFKALVERVEALEGGSN